MKRHTFHVVFWKFLRFTLVPWLKHKFNYTPELYEDAGPHLVLCNHNTDWDPLLLGCAFPQQMYFVASEHIFRWGLTASLLQFFLAPISRLKGTTAGDTALTVIRRLRSGCNVAIFAEGNRSFTGITGEILPSTGKLARVCGATLVTYRLEGGYLSSPRWCGSGLRRGRMRGVVAGVYPPEALRKMSVGEINALIRRDLHCDAYAAQRQEMVPFIGKNLAEHLETVFFLCPKCGAVDSLHSQGDTLACACGFSVRYNEYGFFEGDDAPYDNTADWDAAQTRELKKRLGAPGPLFCDDGMKLYALSAGHSASLLGEGVLQLYSDRLECCGRVFPLTQLSGFSLHGAQSVNFSAGDTSYEITSDQVRCTRKYMTAIGLLLSEAGFRE